MTYVELCKDVMDEMRIQAIHEYFRVIRKNAKTRWSKHDKTAIKTLIDDAIKAPRDKKI